MAATPPISLGMPVFDGEVHLAETLACLRDQTFGDYELLVSDNASTDGTQDVCRSFMRDDPRISYLRNDENRGAAFNYNQVFERTGAPYFKWVSYDDLLAPSYLETCHAVLDAAPDHVALCYPRAYIIDGDGRIVREHDDDFEVLGDNAGRRLVQFARRWSMCNPCFGLHRRAILEQTRLIEPYISSDVTLLAELATRGEFWEVPERLFYRRIHATSSRQGDLSLAATASWFSPDLRAPRIKPTTRVFFEILRSIGQADLGPIEATRAGFAFSGAWSARRLRVRGGRVKRKISRRLDPASTRPAAEAGRL